MSEYECPKCKQVYSRIEFLKSKFCLECERYLHPKNIKNTRKRRKSVEIEPLELTRDQVNIHTLFEEFMRLKDFPMGEGMVGTNVPS